MPRTPSQRSKRVAAICEAESLVVRAATMLAHSDRLNFIETRARRHMAIDFLALVREALAAAHAADKPRKD